MTACAAQKTPSRDWALDEILPAKFIPGFNAAVIPFAGMVRTPLLKFLAVDIPAVTLWSATYTSLGYIFNKEIESLVSYLSTLGTSFFVAVAVVAALYLGHKIHQRRKFLKSLSISRITPEDLKSKLDAKSSVLIFDLRNRLDRIRILFEFPEHFMFFPNISNFGVRILRPGRRSSFIAAALTKQQAPGSRSNCSAGGSH